MENLNSELEIPISKSNPPGILSNTSNLRSYPHLKSSTPRTLDKIASGPLGPKDSIILKENNTSTPIRVQEKLLSPKENLNEVGDLGNLESINSNSSKGVYLSVLLNILFIASFLLEFETETVNRMNFAIQKEIDELFV